MICAAILLALPILAVDRSVTPALLALAVSIPLAAIGAQLEAVSDRAPTYLTIGVLGYLGTRAIIGRLAHPLAFASWWVYPLSSWRQGYVVLPVILGQAWLLRSLCPVVIRRAANARNIAAAILSFAIVVGWGWLIRQLDPASAALICAFAVVLVMLLATGRRYVMIGLIICAGYLTTSALDQKGLPRDVINTRKSVAPDIEFRIRPPAGTSFQHNDLKMFVSVLAQAPTPFSCPIRASVRVRVGTMNPPSASAKDTETRAMLRQVDFALTVAGNTSIKDKRHSGHSILIRRSRAQGGIRSQWRGNLTMGDVFSFSMPLQSSRGVGTCYVEIPQFQARPRWSPAGYVRGPSAASVAVIPAAQTALDFADSTANPTPDLQHAGALGWNCFSPGVMGTTGDGPQCPAFAVAAGIWVSAYDQIALIVVGALMAIAAERWFRRPEPGSADGSDRARPNLDGPPAGEIDVPVSHENGQQPVAN